MADKAEKTDALMTGGSYNAVQSFTEFTSQDPDNVADIKSPYAYGLGVTGITVPVNAWEFAFGADSALRVSDRQDMGSFDEVFASTREVFPCGNVDKIFISAGPAGASGTINFHWNSL